MAHTTKRALRTILPVALGLALATSCRKLPGDGVDGGPPDLGEELTDDEKNSIDRGTGAVPIYQQMIVLADELFDFDPTLDPLKDALQNAAAIRDRVFAQLGLGDGGLGCGSVDLVGDTVTVDFGPLPGCKTVFGNVISGAVAARVGKSGGTLTVSLTFSQLLMNSLSLDGSASFATSTGSSFVVDAQLTTANGMLTATSLTVTGAPGVVIVEGMASMTRNGTKTNFTFRNVRWQLGDCYPKAGSIAVRHGLATTTIAFTMTTPTTGQVMVTLLGKTTTAKLPAYGKCGR